MAGGHGSLSSEEEEMVYVTALWLPIVVAAVVVFVASWIIHVALQYHKNDYKKLPNEDAVLEAMRNAGVEPGDYIFPRAPSHKEMKSPEMVAKYERGPVGFATVMPSGAPGMGKQLVLWFIYSLVVGIFAAYVAGRTLAPGTEYLMVFRITATVAFLAYAGSEAIQSIWMGRSWSSTIKNLIDGLIYGLLTGGVFGSMWPA
jgi:hypothetical protein